MRLRDGVTVDSAIHDLDMVLTSLGNVESDARHYDIPTGHYLDWVAKAEPLLRNFLFEPDPTDLLHTERYWRMVEITAPSLVYPLISNEVFRQRERLTRVRHRLENLRLFASRQGRIVVADTNVYLHFQWENVAKWALKSLTYPGNDLRWVVPLVIIDELDSKKYTSLSRQQSTRARNVLKALEPLIAQDIRARGTAEIEPGLLIEVFDEEDGRGRGLDRDGEILDQAARIQQISGSVTIITDDTNMMTRARLRGLSPERPPEKFRHRPPADGTPLA